MTSKKAEANRTANMPLPLPRGEGGPRPTLSPARAGRAFARRRVIGAQAGQPAAARRRVRDQFHGEEQSYGPARLRSGDGKPSPYKS